MIRRIIRRLLGPAALVACVTATGAPLFAQAIGAGPDSISMRIEQLVSRGEAAAARRLVDSVLTNAGSTDRRYGDALYWSAVLTTSSDSARRTLLRFVVDHPYSQRMEDALIRLADIELRSGDRAAARRHLERMVRDYMVSDRGARAARQLADLMIADGSAIAACDVIDSARTHVSPDNVELTNQLAYSGRTCDQVRIPTQPLATNARPPERADSVLASQPPRAKTGSPPARRGAEWSVQVAAYAIRGDALRLAARLSARGYDARITTDKPYRVRIGRFVNRAAAADVVAKLKSENTVAIIVEAERK